MDLQTAFYIIGIIFMSLMLVLFIALVVAVFVIRAKVVAIHNHIEEKLATVTAVTRAGGEIIDKVKKAAGKVRR